MAKIKIEIDMPENCGECMFFSVQDIHIGHGDTCIGNVCSRGYIVGESKFDYFDNENERHEGCKLEELCKSCKKRKVE